MIGTRALLLATPLLLGTPTTSLLAAHRGTGHHPLRFGAEQFKFSRTARARLRALWNTSTDAKAERVACIGGTVVGDVAYIDRVQMLDAVTRDSTHVLAEGSVRSCRPPEWLGTVHTHVASFNGQPFVTFSADDRNVMWVWNQQWKQAGVFCVLFSDRVAHCESGEQMSGDPNYAEDVSDGLPDQP